MNVSVSIIILNYNSSKYTIDCVNSILDSLFHEYEIILVDNNSNPDEVNLLVNFLNDVENDNVHLIKNNINFGFALGNIFGISRAKGKYIFVLNNDTLVDKEALRVLYAFMEKHSDVSLCIPSQYDKDGVYHSSFAYLPSVANQWLGNGLCRVFNPSEYVDRRKIYEKPFKVQMGSGASMFFRASDYLKVGGLDPNFFLYCEEEDICLRMRKEKMKIFFVPDAKITHYGGGSTNRNIEIELEFYRSLFYFFDKNYNLISSTLLKFRFLIKEFIKLCKSTSRLKIFLSIIFRSSISYSLRHKQVSRS
ncbi:glycosyltransferase family 2 protein [Aeromonas hydrophila]|uniref:glycosyltransferase family 2 protein n=1 Tax=Aeromonas hydrophila TaxID=644 RepID=UPI001303D74B|nr:glycosyltransferase family 2 protein [Aeromonas hydrophila]QGZ71125.1 glycosyltransferase [Aeromonas hydrophila]